MKNDYKITHDVHFTVSGKLLFENRTYRTNKEITPKVGDIVIDGTFTETIKIVERIYTKSELRVMKLNIIKNNFVL